MGTNNVGDKKPYILGVDPGLTGALAVIDPNMEQVVSLWDVPTLEGPGPKKLDIPKLSLQLAQFAGDLQLAVIEEVHSMPRDGHVGAFSFGKVTGSLIGMIAMLFVPIYQTPPVVWKLNYGLSSDKDDSRKLADKKFPFSKHLWARKRDHNRAEAVLLADFGKRFY